jgi:RNA ligase (TIGR02306 family)
MSDYRAEVVRIEKVDKHPDADNLSIAYVLGDYPVVIKTGQFEVGQLACYLSIDNIVPDTEQWYFLCPKKYEKYEEGGEIKQRMVGPKYLLGEVPEKYRIIKAKKFLGIYSQGILIELQSFHNVGDDLVEEMGLKKHEEEEEDNLPSVKTKGKNAEKAPIGWSIPHYDLESARKFLSTVENEQDVILTEKLHGSNAGFCHDGERLVVKSRNFYKKRDEEDMWWDAAIRYDLENKLAKYPKLVFFAECVGQVKGFRYNAEVSGGKLLTKLYFFDIWDTKTMRFLDYDQFATIVADAGLETTPVLYRGPWLGKEEMYKLAERQTTLGGKHIAEGWVLSLGHERYEAKLDSRLKLKYVSETYNLNK